MQIRMFALVLALSSPASLLAAPADPPPAKPAEAPAAPAAPAPQAPADAPTGAFYPKLMTQQEADQRSSDPALKKRGETAALSQRLLESARALRNMGMLALSGVLGLFVSGLIGALIAVGVSTVRARRAAAKPG